MLVGVKAVAGEGTVSLVTVVLARFPLQVFLILFYVDLLVGSLSDPDLGGNYEVTFLSAVRATSSGDMR